MEEEGRLPGHLGQAGGASADHRCATGHGLQDGQAEALVAAGKEEGGAAAVEARQVILRHRPQEAHPALQPQLPDPLLGLGVAWVPGPGDGQGRRGALGHHPSEGLHQGEQVLVGLVDAQVEQVLRGQAELPPHPGHLLPGLGTEMALRGMGNGSHLLGAKGEVGQQILAADLGDGDHVLGGAQSQPGGQPKEEPGAPGDGRGEEQGDQIVEGHHRGQAWPVGHEVVGAVVEGGGRSDRAIGELGASVLHQLPQQPGQGPLLAEGEGRDRGRRHRHLGTGQERWVPGRGIRRVPEEGQSLLRG